MALTFPYVGVLAATLLPGCLFGGTIVGPTIEERRQQCAENERRAALEVLRLGDENERRAIGCARGVSDDCMDVAKTALSRGNTPGAALHFTMACLAGNRTGCERALEALAVVKQTGTPDSSQLVALSLQVLHRCRRASLDPAGSRSSADLCWMAGKLHADGLAGLTPDRRRARTAFELACRLGHRPSCDEMEH